MYKFKNWHVGGGIIFFNDLVRFIDNINQFYGFKIPIIHTMYDSHPGLIMNGGRRTSNSSLLLNKSVYYVKKYNEMGIHFDITFTNTMLTEDDLKDEYCNWFLKQCESEMNGVIVADDKLMQHIREKYPKYKVIASICFCKSDLEWYKKAQKLYDRVILHPDLNDDINFINQLNTNKLEILVNEVCIQNCPFRKQHYDNISHYNRNPQLIAYNNRDFGCIAQEEGICNADTAHKMLLNFGEINRLSNMGISNFKVQGRHADYNTLYTMALKPYIEQCTIQDLIKTALEK